MNQEKKLIFEKSILDRIKELSSNQVTNNLKQPKPLNMNDGQKRNQNDASKIAGKYNKAMDSTNNMVSQQDQQKSTTKGQLQSQMDASPDGSVKMMSRSDFDKKMNDSGGRSINLQMGQQKSINSKTSNYKAELTSNGMVKITKEKKPVNEKKRLGFKEWLLLQDSQTF